MITKTWPYGTTLRCVVVDCAKQFQCVVDERNEGHVLVGDAQDPTAKPGDTGTLTFTEGGPTGGFWKFQKD